MTLDGNFQMPKEFKHDHSVVTVLLHLFSF